MDSFDERGKLLTKFSIFFELLSKSKLNLKIGSTYLIFDSIEIKFSKLSSIFNPSEIDVTLAPDFKTLRMVPWYPDPTAQVICDAKQIDGKVLERTKETVNSELSTGEIEVNIISFEILGKSKELPMPVFSDQDYSEEIRLKYRFLDLRRKKNS